MDTLFAQRLAEERSLQIEVAELVRRMFIGKRRREVEDAHSEALAEALVRAA